MGHGVVYTSASLSRLHVMVNVVVETVIDLQCCVISCIFFIYTHKKHSLHCQYIYNEGQFSSKWCTIVSCCCYFVTFRIKLNEISCILEEVILFYTEQKSDFYARQLICYSAYMLSPARPSVRWVDHRKTVEVRIMKFSPHCSPITLVFAG